MRGDNTEADAPIYAVSWSVPADNAGPHAWPSSDDLLSGEMEFAVRLITDEGQFPSLRECNRHLLTSGNFNGWHIPRLPDGPTEYGFDFSCRFPRYGARGIGVARGVSVQARALC